MKCICCKLDEAKIPLMNPEYCDEICMAEYNDMVMTKLSDGDAKQ